jgi:hypothetical protein
MNNVSSLFRVTIVDNNFHNTFGSINISISCNSFVVNILENLRFGCQNKVISQNLNTLNNVKITMSNINVVRNEDPFFPRDC